VLGVSIEGVTLAEAAGGIAVTSRVARLLLRGGPDAPASLIAKVVNPNWHHGMMLQQREDRFYREIAAHHRLPVPRCWYSAVAGDRFVLLLEDLSDADPGHRLDGYSVSEATRVVQEVAGIHRRFWGGAALPGWPGKTWSEGDIDGLVERYDEHWPKLLAQGKYAVSVEVAEAAERLSDTLPAAMRRLMQGPRTLIHSDLHAENLILDGDRVVILDWQNAAIANPAFDLGGLLVTATGPTAQRTAARSIVAAYHERLNRPDVGLDDLLDEVQAAARWLFAGTVRWLVAFEQESLRDAATVQGHWERLSTGLVTWTGASPVQ